MKANASSFLVWLWPVFRCCLLMVGCSLAEESLYSQNYRLLKDVRPGAAGGVQGNFAHLGDKFFFQGNDGSTGGELWESDGTEAGTRITRNIVPGSNGSSPQYLYSHRDLLFFIADNDSGGREPWVSNGVSTGTQLLKDIYPGTESSAISSFFGHNGKVYFSANDGVNGFELWVSDGTSAGTLMLKDINSGLNSSEPSDFFVYNNKVYFTAARGLNWTDIWMTDGTSFGTQLVKSIQPVEQFFSSTIRPSFLVFKDKFYFNANDGVNGYELWVSDGTTTGTMLFKDISPGPSYSTPEALFAQNDHFFFRANDGVNGKEIWISDGTPVGTMLLKDINPGSGGSMPNEFFSYDNSFFSYKDKVLFTANDGVNGNELWISDGTASGTMLLRDINPGASSSYPSGFTEYLDRVFFLTQNLGIWVTDGTSAGTQFYTEYFYPFISLNPHKIDFFQFKERLYFTHPEHPTYGKEIFFVTGVNDNCTTAAALNVPSDCLLQAFDNFNATSSGDVPAFSCGSAGVSQDVWFKAVVPGSGQLTVQTAQLTGGLQNTIMEIYEGECGNLISVACDDDSGEEQHAMIELSGRTPGETLYIRVMDQLSNEQGAFNICAFGPCGCNGEVDVSPPVISLKPNLTWLQSGYYDNDTFIMYTSLYDSNPFLTTDVITTDDCSEEVSVTVQNSGGPFLDDDNCAGRDTIRWIATDACGNRDSLLFPLKLICDKDITFIDSLYDPVTMAMLPDLTLSDTLRLACNADLTVYERMYPKLGAGITGCNADSETTAGKRKKRPVATAFTDNACFAEIWYWEMSSVDTGVNCGAKGVLSLLVFFENCDAVQTVNQDPIPEDTYFAENSISSSGRVAAGTLVRFVAGQSIRLQPGFRAVTGSDFQAAIETVFDCDDGDPPVFRASEVPAATLPQGTLPISWNIYPNPAREVLYLQPGVDLLETPEIYLYNSQGQLVIPLTVPGDSGSLWLIQTAELSAGFYYLALKAAGQVTTQKVVIIK